MQTQNASRWFDNVVALLVSALAVLIALVASVPAAGVAGAATLTSDLDNLMKIIYSDPLIVDIVKDSELMDLFQKDMNIREEETTGGKYVEMAHYLRLAGAAGARAENDYIPVPQSPRAENSRIYLRKIMGVVEMSGDTMDKVVGDEGSFLNYMDKALPDTKDRVVQQIDRMYAGFGAGIKARINGAPVEGNGYIVVDTALGVAGYEDAWLQFTEGETIVFSNTAAGTALRNAGSAQSALITSIDEVNSRLYITADTALWSALADNDYIFEGDSSGSSSQKSGVDREIAGLLAGCDDGSILTTYNNINRSTAGNRFWNSLVEDASGAPYSGDLTEMFLTILDAKLGLVSGAKADVLVTSPHAPISYWEDLKGDRVINDPRNYTGGKGRLSILLGDRTIPIRTARKLPAQIGFLLTSSTWRRFTLNQWEWVSRQGSIWNLVTDNTGRKDAYFAFGKMYEQLACLKPRANARIEGLSRAFNF